MEGGGGGTQASGEREWCKFWKYPPLVLPHPLSFPRGGGGCHLVNTNIFVAAHCVVVWVTVL